MIDTVHISSSSPFETGNIVKGEKFIGRDEYINRCLRKLKGGGSVALRGIPRIGKTSLAVKLLNSLEDQIDGWNIISIFIDLSTCQTFFHFWRRVVTEIEKRYGDVTTDISLEALLQKVKTAGEDYEKISDAIRSVFSYLCKIKIRTVLFIDEFDSVCRVFGESIQASSLCYFMFMRELMTNSGLFGISLIITSRRSLVNLTKKADGGSVFYNAIETIPIHGFNDVERNAFREYMIKQGLVLSEEDWLSLVKLAGHSPFMLSMAADYLLDAAKEKSVQQTLKDNEARYYQYFDDLIKHLREDDGKDLRRMIQLFIGPKYNLNQNDINELTHSGYIWQETVNGRDRYETLSLRFKQYLKEETHKDLGLDIWPLLTETEKCIRNFIEKNMSAVYSDKWEDELLNKAVDKKKINRPFIDSEKIGLYTRDKKNASKKSLPKQRLIDYLSFSEYSYIISEYWNNVFRNTLFGWGIKDVEKNFRILHDVRNPYAHANEHLLSDSEIQEADLICNKLLERINKP